MFDGTISGNSHGSCCDSAILSYCMPLFAGIGRPSGQMDVASYVLQEFKRAEMEAIDGAIAESLAIIDSCLGLGLDKALSGSRL